MISSTVLHLHANLFAMVEKILSKSDNGCTIQYIPLSMKNISYLIFLVITLSTASLLAQTIPSDSLTPSSTHHYGTQNQFSIGEKDITTVEYAFFLNNQASDEFQESFWFYSKYYDSSFMTTDISWDWMSPTDASIKRTGGESRRYQYDVVPGHENDIIDAVYSADIQSEFADWSKNATEQELCDYVNDKIAGRLDSTFLAKAIEFEHRYPEISVDLFQRVDQMVKEIYDGIDKKDTLPSLEKDGLPYYKIKHYSVSYLNASVFGLQFSDQDHASLQLPSDIPVHAFIADAQNKERRRNWGAMSEIKGRVMTEQSSRKELMKIPKLPGKIEMPCKIDMPGGIVLSL